MKKILSILTIALFATAMVGCNKDNDNNDSNSNSSSNVTLGDNMMIYDGRVYAGESYANFDDGTIHYVFHNSGEADNDIPFEMHGDVYSNIYNRTFDLSQFHEDATFSLHIMIADGGIMDLRYENNIDMLWSFLDGDNMANASCFQNGTATVTVEGDQLSVLVDGVLTNGKTLKYKVVAQDIN